MNVKELKELLEFHDDENEVVLEDAETNIFEVNEVWDNDSTKITHLTIGKQYDKWTNIESCKPSLDGSENARSETDLQEIPRH